VYEISCTHLSRYSEHDQVLIILHAINAPYAHEIYFNLCYLSLAIVCFRNCAYTAIMQTIDRVEKCERYLKSDGHCYGNEPYIERK